MQESGAWEPWLPLVGQRVRVRFRPECVCPHCGVQHGRKWDREVLTVLSIDTDDGAKLLCINCRSPVPAYGHRFCVGMIRGAAYFAAAIELEPVEV